MKRAIILLGLLAVLLAGTDATRLKASTPSFMDNLIRKALEFIRTVLKKNKTYTIQKELKAHVTDPMFNVDMKLSQLKISQADDFKINDIHNDVSKLTANFDMTFPHPMISGDYSIEGSAAERKIKGSGGFLISVENFNQKGFIQMGLKDNSLNMQALKLDFSLDGAKWAFDDMQVEGITKEQALEFMNKNLLPTVNAKKTVICERFAEQIRIRANKMLAGKSLLQIIAWLNKLIKG